MNHLSVTMPAHYRILLRGGLDENWSCSLSDMKISVSVNAEKVTITTLKGELQDQAALMGVLNQIYDLGLPLILVQWMDECEKESSMPS